MKNILTYTIAPVLAFLAAGCATPMAMQSTEYDDMYYSKADKTVFIQPEVQQTEQAYQAEGEAEVTEPAYAESRNATQRYSGDEYYDGRTYDARESWYQPDYAYVDPSWGMAYVPSYSSRYSYFYNDPFYDPFYGDPFYYDPFMRRGPWGSGLSVSIGYNMGWGRSPYYSSWYPNNSYYHGYNRGFYNGYYSNPSRYYGNNYYYDTPIVYGKQRRVQYGPRDGRGGTVTNSNTANRTRTERTEAIQTGNGGRPARTSQSQQAVTPAENNNQQAQPARPSRNTDRNIRGRQSRSVDEQQPSVQPQEQRSVTPAPATRETRRSRRQESAPAQPRYEQQQRQIRTQESQPTRNYESRPSRSQDSSPSYTPSNNSNSNSSGGRPRRGN